ERHARFTLASGPRRALGVAFGVNGELGAAAATEGGLDVSVALEVNQWNGAIEPRVVLGSLYEPSGAAGRVPARPDAEEWWGRVDAELEAPIDRWPRLDLEEPSPERREIVDRRGNGGVAAVAALASAGGAVLVL